MSNSHTVVVKGMDANHVVLATDSITIEGADAPPEPPPGPQTIYGAEPECFYLSYETNHSAFSNGKWEGKSLSERTIDQSLTNSAQIYQAMPGCTHLMEARTTRSSGVRVYDMGGNLTISASTLVSRLNAKFKVHNSSYGVQSNNANSSYEELVDLSWSDAVITNGKLTSIKLTGLDSAPSIEQDRQGALYMANRYFWIMLGSNGQVYNASLRPGAFASNTIGGPLLAYRGGFDPDTITGFNDYERDQGLLARTIYYTWDEFLNLFRSQNGLASSVTFDLLLAYAKSPVTYVPEEEEDD